MICALFLVASLSVQAQFTAIPDWLREQVPEGIDSLEEFSQFQHWLYIQRAPFYSQLTQDLVREFRASATRHVNLAYPNPHSPPYDPSLDFFNANLRSALPTDVLRIFQRSLNCYGYACGQATFDFEDMLAPLDPGDLNSVGLGLADISDIRQEGGIYVGQLNVMDVLALAIMDGLHLSPQGNDYPVYFVVGQSARDRPDHHWYRHNSDGTWSHRPGDTAVRNVDASGRVINNPLFANHNYSNPASGYGINYNVPGCFLWVPRFMNSSGRQVIPIDEFFVDHDDDSTCE